jgi:glutamate 5-kinase
MFSGVKRVAVKVGTGTLSREENLLDLAFMDALMDQVAEARDRGIETVIITSGAVGAGMGSLQISRRPTAIDELQALAAIGQSLLMHHYARAAAHHDIRVAQVLLTSGEMTQKASYLHVQNALRALLRMNAVPIVNENDSTAVEELRFGDNDSLSAHVANLANADLLVLLTDIDGLYNGDPSDPNSELIHTVDRIDHDLEAICGGAGSETGTGGMLTKVGAAKTLAASGIPTVIAHGRKVTLGEVLSGEPVGTLFVPQVDKTRMHYRWILAQKVCGRVVIDEGAARALLKRRTSLLPSGVTRVVGRFKLGEAVSVRKEDGTEVARGLAAYPASEARKIAGRQSSEIEDVIGHNAGDEMIHRDNLVIVLNGR